MPPRKTVETAFGAVDEKVLEALQNSFDTRRLLDAVEAIDHLHRMAVEVINDRGELQKAADLVSEEE